MSRVYRILNRIPDLWKIKFILILSILALLIPSLGGTAFAYNRNNAVAYAERWALSRNTNYPSYGADCTNFASQALAAGGYGQVNLDNNPSNLNNWYSFWFLGHFIAAHSWYNAPDHYQFQWNHVPGGYFQDSVGSASARYFYHYDATNMVAGDELFYSWNGNGKIDHMAFQVYSGYSQYMLPHTPSWYGDLSDQHVTDRYHVSWNHLEVNSQWPTTIIYEMHIGDGN